MTLEWYYARNGQPAGPFTAEQLQQMVATGQLVATDHLWRQGQDAWRPLQEMAAVLAAAIPPPLAGAARLSQAPSASGATGILLTLSGLALTQLAGQTGEKIAGWLTSRFTDPSQRLSKALQEASNRAWQALEIALAGESFWDRCKNLFAAGEDKGFAQQVRVFLDTTPLPSLTGKDAFRRQCLSELQAARKAGALNRGTLEPHGLAEQTADFARFGDAGAALDAEWAAVARVAEELKPAYAALAWLLSQRAAQGEPLLVIAVRYFFRRAVEGDTQLFQGMTFAQLQGLGRAQQEGFAGLAAVLDRHGRRVEEMLADLHAVAVETRAGVDWLKEEMGRQGSLMQQMYQRVITWEEQLRLRGREVRASDGCSIRTEDERSKVKAFLAEYRALPEAQRRQQPSLLNAIGKLEHAAGDFAAAQRDFQQAAALAPAMARAEAHHNAYQAALAREDWPGALAEFQKAVALAPGRFAPFQLEKYQPERILGAGGFGVAFLCRNANTGGRVVVKTLRAEEAAGDLAQIVQEARILETVEHPAVIRLRDCEHADTGRTRPFLVMDYFEAKTLHQEVEKRKLTLEEFLPLARLLAEGLQAAHARGLWHRDVKPANVLVRRETGESSRAVPRWQVKLIDFGLAKRQAPVDQSGVSTGKRLHTASGETFAGTQDYAAPEQMGRLPGVKVGPYSDVYGFGKTCCYALFQTTEPLPEDWDSVPQEFRRLLSSCLQKAPDKRPQSFIAVLEALDEVAAGESEQAAAPRTPQQEGLRAVGALVAGVALLAVLCCLIRFLSAAVGGGRHSHAEGILLTLALLHNAAVLVGAYHLFRLKQYGLALAGGVLVGGSWFWPLFTGISWWFAIPGLLLGILVAAGTLHELLAPQAKQAFRKPSSFPEALAAQWAQWRRAKLLWAFGAALGLLAILNIVILLHPVAAPVSTPSERPSDLLIGKWTGTGTGGPYTAEFTKGGLVIVATANGAGINGHYEVLGSDSIRVKGDRGTWDKIKLEFPSHDQLIMARLDFDYEFKGMLAGRLQRVGTGSGVDPKTPALPFDGLPLPPDGLKPKGDGPSVPPTLDSSLAAKLVGKWQISEGKGKGATVEFTKAGKAMFVYTDPLRRDRLETVLGTYSFKKDATLQLERAGSTRFDDGWRVDLEFLGDDDLLLVNHGHPYGGFGPLAGRLKRVK